MNREPRHKSRNHSVSISGVNNENIASFQNKVIKENTQNVFQIKLSSRKERLADSSIEVPKKFADASQDTAFDGGAKQLLLPRAIRFQNSKEMDVYKTADVQMYAIEPIIGSFLLKSGLQPIF